MPRRPAARTRSEQSSGIDAMESTFKRAAEKSGKFLPTLRLENEQSAYCRFIEIPGWDPKPILTHSVKINGKFQMKICRGKGCQLCAVGIYASPAGVLPLINLKKRSYTTKDGETKTVVNEKLILLVRKGSFPRFKKLIKSGKLFSRVICVTRYGVGRDTSYDPEALKPLEDKYLNLEYGLDLAKICAPVSEDEAKRLARAYAYSKDAPEDDDDDFFDKSDKKEKNDFEDDNDWEDKDAGDTDDFNDSDDFEDAADGDWNDDDSDGSTGDDEPGWDDSDNTAAEDDADDFDDAGGDWADGDSEDEPDWDD